MNAAARLADGAGGILLEPAPDRKVVATYALAEAWRRGDLPVGDAPPPLRPARPERPELRRPGDMPKRSMGPKGRIAFLHALAHIELTAVNLAWDIVARFTAADLPRGFYDDWVSVAVDEARHYTGLARRLTEGGAAYGDLPAHDSLWDAAQITADDLMARLALIPMTHEARGLDTTPGAVARCTAAGDAATAGLLQEIYDDEIKHLAIGVRWFEFCCARAGAVPTAHYAHLIAQRFRGAPKGPFNLEARAAAGMGEDYLRPWL